MQENWKDQIWECVLEATKKGCCTPDLVADSLIQAHNKIYGGKETTSEREEPLASQDQ